MKVPFPSSSNIYNFIFDRFSLKNIELSEMLDIIHTLNRVSDPPLFFKSHPQNTFWETVLTMQKPSETTSRSWFLKLFQASDSKPSQEIIKFYFDRKLNFQYALEHQPSKNFYPVQYFMAHIATESGSKHDSYQLFKRFNDNKFQALALENPILTGEPLIVNNLMDGTQQEIHPPFPLPEFYDKAFLNSLFEQFENAK